MGAINYAMSDIYGGYNGTTEMTIPDADDQNALTNTENADKAVSKSVTASSNTRMYLAILLVLIILIVIGGAH